MPIASILTPELREMLETHDTEGLREFCEAMHPASTADFLEELDASEIWQVLGHTDPVRQAAIFQYFPQEKKLALMREAARPRLARLLEEMASDDRVDLIQDLDPELREAVLPLVAHAEREDMRRLLSYAEDSVGSVMTTDYAWFPEDLTAGDSLARLRLQAPESETIYYVYVLDADRHLVGTVSLRQLIMAKPSARLSDVMERNVLSIPIAQNKEEAARTLARYDFLAMPVVDPENRLVGIITHDDVMDVVVEAATEDAHRMGAVGPMTENYLEANFATVWRKRAFWLSCLFVSEMFTFSALAYFESEIEAIVALALFVPLCISTGGNSGSQAATLITRAMALGQVKLSDWYRVIRHELFMGLALGLALGAIGFIRAALTPEEVLAKKELRTDKFQARIARDHPLVARKRRVVLPGNALEAFEGIAVRKINVLLPTDAGPEVVPEESTEAYTVYHFPANCEVRFLMINRWELALVISQAVSIICLWGTLVGSTLPLVFRRFGVDPGIASSPFVATFVDVTGIVIYFSIAKLYLL